MMFTFVSLVWDAENRALTTVCQRLVQVLQCQPESWDIKVRQSGLTVLTRQVPGHSVDEQYLLSEGSGIVMGRLFSRSALRDQPTSKIDLGDDQSRAIVESRGRYLIDNFWGQYLAFMRSERTGEVTVLRDPSGGVCCEKVTIDGVDVYYHRFTDCERLPLPPLTINRKFLAGRLAFSVTSRRESGLNEISVVLPGERITRDSRGVRSDFVWNPLEVAATDVLENSDVAVATLRETVRGCVHAWASTAPGILHSLSGGLDSTLVVTCLADAPTKPNVICVNYHSPGSNSDERFYARLAATNAGFPLIEKSRNMSVDMECLRALPRSPFPFFSIGDPAGAAEEAALAGDNGLGLMFTGDGGDELFYKHGRLPTSVDFAYGHPFHPRLVPLMLDDATRQHTSFWTVLRLVGKHGTFRRRWAASDLFPRTTRPLLLADTVELAKSDETLIHPAFRDPPGIAPAKIDQAYINTLLTMRVDTPMLPAGYPACVSPLIAQPMMELSLRIPTYILTKGGRDRAIAREAFRADAPAKIIDRHAKGGVEGYVKGLFARNKGLVLDLLLDGYLAKERYIDRKKLERFLSGQPVDFKVFTIDLMSYVCIEGWARNWYGRERRAAA